MIKTQKCNTANETAPMEDVTTDIVPGLPPEKPQDRDNVSVVSPEDYPLGDREIATVAAVPLKKKPSSLN